MEKRVPLQFSPGLYKAGTVYQSKGRWYDANLVRFIAGAIRPVGGWIRMQSNTGAPVAALTGIPRAMRSWRTDGGAIYVGVGTTQKLYVIASGVLTDITPVGLPSGRLDTVINQASSAEPGSAFGTGKFGRGRYGQGSTVGDRYLADTWQLDTFGEYLVGVSTADQKLYVWEGNLSAKAAVPAGSPTAQAVVVTPERFLFLLGADGVARRVQWPSQETYAGSANWNTADPTNSAGFFDLATDGALVCGRKTRRETLLFTDVDLWTATYIGGDLIYRFDQAGKQCGIVSPNAVASFDTEAMWMGFDSFFAYDGFVRPIPCDVHDYVFSDFNRLQGAKVWSTTVSQFGEAWWFYPSAKSQEPDRYVCYNYREKHWTAGQLQRSAGIDSGATPFPIFADGAGLLYDHENGNDRGGVEPYLESGPSEIGEGDQVMDVLGIVADEKTLGDLKITVYSQYEPMGAEQTNGPYTLDTALKSARFSGRQVRVRIVENLADPTKPKDWRVGVPRLLVTPAGLR